MDIELIREQVRINSFVGEETIQAVIEDDIIVPDSKPDIESVLRVSGDIYTAETQVMQDKVVIDGCVRYKILYLCNDELQPVRSMTATVSFSENVAVLGIRAGMNPFISFNIQYIGHSVINGRKINIKTIADIAVKAASDNVQDIVVDVRGIDDAQICSEAVKISGIIGDEQDSFIVREEFPIPEEKPAINEILNTDAWIAGKDMKLTDDKVIVKGDLIISALYVADDERQSIQFVRREIPFTQFMDFPGMNENRNCELHYELKDFFLEPCDNDDGELRNISIEASVDARVACVDSTEFEMVVDAYSPTYDMNIERESTTISQYVVEGLKEQEILRERVLLSDDAPELREIVNVVCGLNSADYEVYEDRVAIEGVVNFDIMYLSEEVQRPIHCYLQEVPFKKVVSTPGAMPGMKCELVAEPGTTAYNILSSAEIEIQQTIELYLRVKKDVNIQVITGAKLEPIDKNFIGNMPSIVMYYVQQGDTLWNIAKRYYTTVQDIVEVNALQNIDKLEEGQYIIIPKKVV